MTDTDTRARDEADIRGVVKEHTKADGGPQDLWFRATLGLRKTGGTWKITHEHNSTPFYMDGSGRAANDLRPEASDA